MPIRFILFWLAASIGFYVVIYLFGRKDRRHAWRIGKRVTVSALAGMALIIPLFFLNQLSGL